MAAEVDTLLGRKAWRPRGRTIPCKEGDRHLIRCAGIGAEPAQRAAETMVSQRVAALVSIGLGGGLDPELGTGHIVIASEVLHADLAAPLQSWPTHTPEVERAYADFMHGGLVVTRGRIVTVPHAVCTCRSKESLFKRTGALAVDMESSAVARVACQAGIPFFGLRVICDPAQMTVPQELVTCLKPDGRVRLSAVVRCLLRRPALLQEIIPVARSFALARQSLGQAWRRLAAGPLLHNSEIHGRGADGPAQGNAGGH
jgi:adenosylhomocysteine nucleosidase